jgi:hypothetical protein
MGSARCSVESGRMLAEASVEEGARCLPAKTRRRLDVGRFVRSSIRDFSVEMVVDGGSERGIAVAGESVLASYCK